MYANDKVVNAVPSYSTG